MRILYLYPEEWTGRRAREIHTLHTAAALAAAGAEVHLITASPIDLNAEINKIQATNSPHLTTQSFTRIFHLAQITIRSHLLFSTKLNAWYKKKIHKPFDIGFAIHLKAARWFQKVQLPYLWEAHEIFSETSPKRYHLESLAIFRAAKRIATSHALARALQKTYRKTIHFEIVPNAGHPPSHQSAYNPTGPILYAGSIENWKGLHVALSAALALDKAVRIIGGDFQQKQHLMRSLPYPERHHRIQWHARQNRSELLHQFQGASVGIISTDPDTPSGRYSCPMKLFDYASAGLPVIASPLPSLTSLGCGPWLKIVSENRLESWIEALQTPPQGGFAPQQWASENTWEKRAQKILSYLAR
jgi:glycosyltransferase involved in cell wall biosynthesis